MDIARYDFVVIPIRQPQHDRYRDPLIVRPFQHEGGSQLIFWVLDAGHELPCLGKRVELLVGLSSIPND